jgi:hypothetical protein
VFISIEDYRKNILGKDYSNVSFNDDFAVTLEVSATQYFSWIRSAAERVIERRELMPGRYIKVRKMKEQEIDGDLPAIAASKYRSKLCET